MRQWPSELINWFVRMRHVLVRVAAGHVILPIGDRVVVTDSQGELEESDITTTELDTLDGIQSNVQAQLDTKTPKGYGGLSVNGNTNNLALAAQDTWYQYPYFDTNDPSLGMTPDHTNDHITVGTTGVYFVSIDASFSGSVVTTFEVQMFINNGATGFPNVHFERKIGTGGDIGAAPASGIVSLTSGDTVELWVERTDGGGTSKNFLGRDVTISLIRLA
jgi:hypothetical protein